MEALIRKRVLKQLTELESGEERPTESGDVNNLARGGAQEGADQDEEVGVFEKEGSVGASGEVHAKKEVSVAAEDP